MDPSTIRIRPTTTRIIPMLHKMAIFAANPIISRMMPRMIIYFSWPSFDGMMS
jgi:hypothetical protein